MTIRHNIQIRQGETWSFTYTHLDSAGSAVDITGYSGRMSIKSSFSQGTGIDVGAIAHLSDGSDADGGTLTLGDAAGTVLMEMTAAQTADLASGFVSSSEDSTFKLKYDLELVSGAGAVTRALEGEFIVVKEITT